MLEQPRWLHHGRSHWDQCPLLHYTTMTACCKRYKQLEFVFKMCTRIVLVKKENGKLPGVVILTESSNKLSALVMGVDVLIIV